MDAALRVGAAAATDVTGFGLAGHALEMGRASDAGIVLDLSRLPVLPGAETLAAAGHHTRANATNRAHVDPDTRYEGDAGQSPRIELLFDPQTSGGLLVAVAADRADAMLAQCDEAGFEAAAVGVVEERGDATLIIRG